MKLRLTLNSGTLHGRTFELETGVLTIGRGDTCDVRFDPRLEGVVSTQHAFIEAKADGYYLTDSQSANGTFLNAVRITTARLTSGDRIQFGENGIMGTVSIQTNTVAASTEGSFPPKLVTAVKRRYRDGYLYARFLNTFGAVVIVFGILVVFVGIFIALWVAFGVGGAAMQSSPYGGPGSGTGFFLGFISFLVIAILAASFGVFFIINGILIRAGAQMMKASFDSSVYASPFLKDQDRAEVMSLPLA